jgi:hypothetical protein
MADSLAVEITVENIQLGFRLRTHTPVMSGLMPEWRVLCSDGETYYLDAFDGGIMAIED